MCEIVTPSYPNQLSVYLCVSMTDIALIAFKVSCSNRRITAQDKQQLLLFIQSLSSHEDFHLCTEGKCAIVFAETVQQFGILEDWPLITH